MEVLDYKCPTCNAKLPFNPMTQKWDCEYCGNQYDLETLKDYENKSNEEEQNEADMYTCSSCGAKIITNHTTTATCCVYCGNTSIIKNRFEYQFLPNYIIPFHITKEDAIKRIKKRKLLLPKDFWKKENIEKMVGIYIPYWLFDFDVDGSIKAECQKKASRLLARIEEDTYAVYRKATIKIKKVPIEGLSRIDDKTITGIEPFNYTELRPFEMSYLSGYFSESYDITRENAIDIAKSRVIDIAIEKLKETIQGYGMVAYLDSDVKPYMETWEYVLLPVWILNIEHNNQTYFFAVNGQTGKTVENIPIEKPRIKKIWIQTFLLSFVICSIIALFLM